MCIHLQASFLPCLVSKRLQRKIVLRFAVCVFVLLFSEVISVMFLFNRQLYNLCQMFPESASDSIKFVLRDAMHEMEEMIETKGRALFPGLDVVSRDKVHQIIFSQPPEINFILLSHRMAGIGCHAYGCERLAVP